MTEMTLEKFDEYLQLHYSNANTRRQYLNAGKRFRKMSAFVTQSACERYLSAYKNNVLNRSFLKVLCECFNVDIEIPEPRSRRKERSYKYLLKEDIDRIIQKTSPKTSLLVQLFFETGLRLEEIIDLKRDNIHLERRRLVGHGKGGKRFDEPFSAHMEVRLREFLEGNEAEHPFHYGVKHEGKKFWYDLRKECSVIGIRNMHPHKLRHSLAHYLRTVKKWDLVQIKVKLHHSDISTTEIYADASKEEVDRKMKEEVFEDGNKESN